jgi:hypothetical protein
MDKPQNRSGSVADWMQLGQRLREAARARQWAALARIDTEIGGRLHGCDLSQFSTPELAALQKLRDAHAEALLECQRELQRLGETLDQMRQRREGWQAYAESQDWLGPRFAKGTAA